MREPIDHTRPSVNLQGRLFAGGELITPELEARYEFGPRGIVREPPAEGGRIVGTWFRHTKSRRRYLYRFAEPIEAPARAAPRVERRDITIDGRLYRDVPVQVYDAPRQDERGRTPRADA